MGLFLFVFNLLGLNLMALRLTPLIFLQMIGVDQVGFHPARRFGANARHQQVL